MGTGTERRGGIVLHPSWSRFAWTASFAIGLAVLPPFLSLYWLTIPTGGWPVILAIHAVTITAVTVASLRVRQSVVEIDETTIRKRGYFGRLVVTPRSELASVLVLPLLAGSSQETSMQLFVLDRDGRTRARMRGQYWSDEALVTVQHALDVPVQRLASPITRHELRARYRLNLYWHERHPRLTFAGGAVLGALIATPVFVVIEQLI